MKNLVLVALFPVRFLKYSLTIRLSQKPLRFPIAYTPRHIIDPTLVLPIYSL